MFLTHRTGVTNAKGPMPVMITGFISRKIAGFGFICACMVVFLHQYISVDASPLLTVRCYRVIRNVCGMAVPAFFVFSGFLLAGHMAETGWWRKECKKRLGTLLLPFLIWNAFDLFFHATLGTVSAALLSRQLSPISWSQVSALDSLCKIAGVYPLQFPQLSFLWFVRCLFVLVLASPVIGVVFRRWWTGVLSATLLVSFSLYLSHMISDADFENYFMICSWVQGVAFFGIGIWLRWNGGRLSRCVPCRPVTGIFLLSFGVLLVAIKGFYNLKVCDDLSALALLAGLWLCVRDLRVPKSITSLAFPVFLFQKTCITIQSIALMCLIKAVGVFMGGGVCQRL